MSRDKFLAFSSEAYSRLSQKKEHLCFCVWVLVEGIPRSLFEALYFFIILKL